MNVLVGVTGSVATIRLPLLLSLLESKGFNVKVVATQAALHFIDSKSFHPLTDKDEWNSWKSKGDPVLHIELRKWADVLLIAPLDANTLAKLANGICDNLLTCVLRAWDYDKHLILCPAMNTFMYKNPITQRHIDTIREVYMHEHSRVTLVDPISKILACGDEGIGGMAKVEYIVNQVYMQCEACKKERD